jgi:plasmid maintenance system antidote protein VapI
MSIANTRPLNRGPTHPGAMLREDFLPEFWLNARRAVDLRSPRTAGRVACAS